MAGTKISDATTTAPIVGTDMIPFARSADATARHVTVASFLDRAIVINESGADVDYRVEAVGQENALFVQGSDGAIGFGTAAPLTIHTDAGEFADKSSRFEVITGDTAGTYEEFVSIRHSNINSDIVQRTIGLLFKLSDETSEVRSDKMGGIILESPSTYANTPDLHLVTANEKRLTIKADGRFVFNNAGIDADFRVEAVGQENALFVQGSDGNVGVNIGVPVAKFHVDQTSTTGAMPVLLLDQADVDEDYIKIIGTSDTNADRALVDAADFPNIGAIKAYLKVYIQDDQATNPIVDGDYYIPVYAVPTA